MKRLAGPRRRGSASLPRRPTRNDMSMVSRTGRTARVLVVASLTAAACSPPLARAHDTNVEVTVTAPRATVLARSAVFGHANVDRVTAEVARDRILIAWSGGGLLAVAVDGRVVLLDLGLRPGRTGEARLRDLIPAALYVDHRRQELTGPTRRLVGETTIPVSGSRALCAAVRRLPGGRGTQASECRTPFRGHAPAGTRDRLADVGMAHVTVVADRPDPLTCDDARNTGLRVLYEVEVRGYNVVFGRAATAACSGTSGESRRAGGESADALVLGADPAPSPSSLQRDVASWHPGQLIVAHPRPLTQGVSVPGRALELSGVAPPVLRLLGAGQPAVILHLPGLGGRGGVPSG